MAKILVIIEKVENSYGAYSPDVPGCVAVGDTRIVTVPDSAPHGKIAIAACIFHQLSGALFIGMYFQRISKSE